MMKFSFSKIAFLMLILNIFSSSVWAQSDIVEVMDKDTLLTNQVIEELSYKNVDVKDVIRHIANKYRINIFIDNSIQQRVTIQFTR